MPGYGRRRRWKRRRLNKRRRVTGGNQHFIISGPSYFKQPDYFSKLLFPPRKLLARNAFTIQSLMVPQTTGSIWMGHQAECAWYAFTAYLNNDQIGTYNQLQIWAHNFVNDASNTAYIFGENRAQNRTQLNGGHTYYTIKNNYNCTVRMEYTWCWPKTDIPDAQTTWNSANQALPPDWFGEVSLDGKTNIVIPSQVPMMDPTGFFPPLFVSGVYQHQLQGTLSNRNWPPDTTAGSYWYDKSVTLKDSINWMKYMRCGRTKTVILGPGDEFKIKFNLKPQHDLSAESQIGLLLGHDQPNVDGNGPILWKKNTEPILMCKFVGTIGHNINKTKRVITDEAKTWQEDVPIPASYMQTPSAPGGGGHDFVTRQPGEWYDNRYINYPGLDAQYFPQASLHFQPVMLDVIGESTYYVQEQPVLKKKTWQMMYDTTEWCFPALSFSKKEGYIQDVYPFPTNAQVVPNQEEPVQPHIPPV